MAKVRVTVAERMARLERKLQQLKEPAAEKVVEPRVKKEKVIAATVERPPLPDVPVVEWQDAYGESWKGVLVDEAFAHPAKASRALLKKIFDHLTTIGAIRRGSIVIDPFGGIGTTAIECSWRGMQVMCVELEPKFRSLMCQNLLLHAQRGWCTCGPDGEAYIEYLKAGAAGANPDIDSRLPPEVLTRIRVSPTSVHCRECGKLVIPYPMPFQGDSRRLRQYIRPAVDAVISSPPYTNEVVHGRPSKMTEGIFEGRTAKTGLGAYGDQDGQLADMETGSVDAVISSPPYEEIATGAGGLNTKPAKEGQQGGRSAAAPSQDTDQRYGDAEGQLAKLPKGDVDVVVSSPPYSPDALGHPRGEAGEAKERALGISSPTAYGDTEGQIENLPSGDVDVVISSPPYTGDVNLPADGIRHSCRDKGFGGSNKCYGDEDGQMSRLPVGHIDAVVSSPPYVSGGHHTDVMDAWNANEGGQGVTKDEAGYGKADGQMGRLKEGSVDAIISSPPFGDGDSASAQSMTRRTDKSAEWVKANCGSAATEGYGETAGQLAEMSMKESVDAVISSPPYSTAVLGDGHRGGDKQTDKVLGSMMDGYGEAEGQLQHLETGDVDAVITSPPFLGSHNGLATDEEPRQRMQDGRLPKTGMANQIDYGESEGQVGTMPPETFWTAARDIVAETYHALKPGGHAVWIVKAFVRDKQIVDFPADWRRLCEYIGFETLTEVRAMLVKEVNEGVNLFGEESIERKERKSFFRRLAEKKGSPRIDYEVVYVMRKPDENDRR